MQDAHDDIRYAGFFSRLAAAIIDYSAIFFIFNMFTYIGFNFSFSISTVITFFIFWLYFAFTVSKWQGTIGNLILGIKIKSADSGERLSLLHSSIRFFLSIAPFVIYQIIRTYQHSLYPQPSMILQQLPQLIYLLAPMVMFFTPKKQMLHDLAVHSVVINDNAKSNKPINYLRLIIIVVVLLVFVASFARVAIYTAAFAMLYYSKQQSYDASFHTKYNTHDYNDTNIIFYKNELEKYEKDFINAKGMYDIFAANTKAELAQNCIEVLVQEHNNSKWIEEGSAFYQNARNKYATSKELIIKAKANEDYLGAHFYDYDMNDVDDIERKYIDAFDINKSKNICNKRIPIDDIYREFIYRYIANREEELESDIQEEKNAKPFGNLDKSFYKKIAKQTKAWLNILYAKYPDYSVYRTQQKLLAEQREKARREKQAEKVRTEKEQALWKSAIEGVEYPMGYLKGVNANIRNKEGLTPLMVAVKNGHSHVIDTWTMDGVIADVWAKDTKGKTAWDYIKTPTNQMKKIFTGRMHGALRWFEVYQIVHNKADIVSLEYNNDTDLLKITIDGDICEHFVFSKHTECQALKPTSNHPIFKAIKAKDNALFDKLLPTVKDFSIQNKDHYSLLWASILYHNHYALKHLLEETDVDKYEIDPLGLKTPVYWAAMQNDIQSLQILLNNGVDVNSTNIFGNTALFGAIHKCGHFEVVRILLEHGADPYHRNKYGENVFDKLAASCKDKEKVEEMKKLFEEKSHPHK